jgi:hypothetical protein
MDNKYAIVSSSCKKTIHIAVEQDCVPSLVAEGVSRVGQWEKSLYQEGSELFDPVCPNPAGFHFYGQPVAFQQSPFIVYHLMQPARFFLIPGAGKIDFDGVGRGDIKV